MEDPFVVLGKYRGLTRDLSMTVETVLQEEPWGKLSRRTSTDFIRRFSVEGEGRLRVCWGGEDDWSSV